MRKAVPLALALLTMFMAGCGGGNSFTSTPTPPQPTVTVNLSPSSSSIRLYDSQQFTANVTGTTATAVNWSLNGTPAPVTNSANGSLTVNGLYTAPTAVPSGTVTIQATSQADLGKSASVAITLMNPIPAVSSVIPASIDPGAFTIAVTGTKFVNGAKVNFGGTDLTTTFVSATQLRATGNATQSAGASVNVSVANPNTSGDTVQLVSGIAAVPINLISSKVAARFLDQATFGATPTGIAHVAQIGLQAYLNEQFAATPSTFPDVATLNGAAPSAQSVWMHNALTGQDQLRQRMAFSLGQIWVISGVTINASAEYVPLLRILQNDAFGNFRQLMEDVTLSPAMGDYLNMVNNDKPDPAKGTHANENYAREIMQLFTIGLAKLNPDGTPKLDASGNPIATYDQTTIQEMSRALTGWTYPNLAGRTTPTSGHNPVNFVGQMVAVEANHDTGPKTLLNGTVVPAGQTSAQDLKSALDNIFNDPDVGPFICRNLIEHFVTSNPNGAYLSRCTAAFNDNGSGVRGDLKAVLSEILLDTEARRADYPNAAAANDGHLREPILFVTSVLRNLNATVDATGNAERTLVGLATNMGQTLLYSPTVFNYYPPDWLIPGTRIYGPEFALQTTATATVRVNFVNSAVGGVNNGPVFAPVTGMSVDVSPYASLANDSNTLLDALDTIMMHGQMSSQMRASVKTAVDAIAVANATQRAKTAIYLIGSSSQYQVVH
jgi:uncharacterized protein (DUF1800 family)